MQSKMIFSLSALTLVGLFAQAKEGKSVGNFILFRVKYDENDSILQPAIRLFSN